MRKAIFIIPFFGKFKSYFPLFLKSCSYNKDFNWLIITDDKTTYDYPENVRIIYKTFEQLKREIQAKFNFKISLNRPYKLCDYKPSYGYIFNDLIKDYKMWGYCDTDLIFGKISDFITNNDIQIYDKIGILGHCTLIKNDKKHNTSFMLPINGVKVYKKYFQDENTHSFDEEFNESINNIFENNGFSIKKLDKIANVYTKSSNFRLTYLSHDKHNYYVEKNRKNSFFLFSQGKLYRYSLSNNQIDKEEYMYIHMQSRKMKISPNISEDQFKIIPNSFDKLEFNNVSLSNFMKIKKKHFNLHYFKLRSKNLFLKLRKKLKLCLQF